MTVEYYIHDLKISEEFRMEGQVVKLLEMVLFMDKKKITLPHGHKFAVS